MRAKNVIHLAILACASVTASADGAGIDISAYAGDVKFTLDSGAGTGTTPTLDVKLQESDDNITFTDVTGGAFAQVTDAGAAFETLTVSVDGLKKYVRGVDAVTGTTPVFPRALSMIGEKQYS